jgi:hypothetical protein
VTRTQPDNARHPAMLAVTEQTSADLQTTHRRRDHSVRRRDEFAYLQAVLFAIWMLAFENSPWPTLTLIVSLEAIFLSTFVMIGQNRQAAYQQAKADHDFNTGEQELHLNIELTKLIHQLTPEIHTERLCQPAPARPPQLTRIGHLTTQIAASCAPRLLSYRHPVGQLRRASRIWSRVLSRRGHRCLGSGHEPRK